MEKTASQASTMSEPVVVSTSCESVTKTASQARRRIASGQQRLKMLRMKIACFLFFLGMCCFVGDLLFKDWDWRELVCRTDAPTTMLFVFLAALWNLRIVVWAFIPMYGDVQMMRLTMMMEVVMVVTFNLAVDTKVSLRYLLNQMVCHGVLIVGFARASCFQDANRMQRWMWTTIQVWNGFNIVGGTAMAILSSVRCGFVCMHVLAVPLQVWVTIALRSKQRQRYQSILMSWLEGRSQARAAATIAALVGNCSASQVVQLASARFRSIELAVLSKEDLADNKPNPALYEKSSPAGLNEVDAFISHSWHDDADTKWEALQAWRCRFIAKHGREPKLWFDKCCIDQNNIETDLRCLPVFIVGCRKMVVFCGATYLSRLWCILELFTFVHMGRSLNNLEFEMVLGQGTENQDLSKVEGTLDEFDVEECNCFVAEDKAKILDIICVAFGSMFAFNSAVRATLHATRLRDACAEHLVAGESGVESPSASKASSMEGEMNCSQASPGASKASSKEGEVDYSQDGEVDSSYEDHIAVWV